MLLLNLFSFCEITLNVYSWMQYLLFYYFTCPWFSTIKVFSEVLLDLGSLSVFKIWGTDSLYSFSSQLYILNIVYFGTSAAFKEISSMEKFQPVKVSLQTQKKKIKQKCVVFILGTEEKVVLFE